MYPMITSTEEVKKIYEIVAEVEAELKEQEIQYKIPEQGNHDRDSCSSDHQRQACWDG